MDLFFGERVPFNRIEESTARDPLKDHVLAIELRIPQPQGLFRR